jgi:hypothetical protein
MQSFPETWQTDTKFNYKISVVGRQVTELKMEDEQVEEGMETN